MNNTLSIELRISILQDIVHRIRSTKACYGIKERDNVKVNITVADSDVASLVLSDDGKRIIEHMANVTIGEVTVDRS